MNSTLWSISPSNQITPPARRSTTSHGAAHAALGCRRDSKLVRIVIAAAVALFILSIAPRGHADTSMNSQSLALVNQTRAANGLRALSENAALDRIAAQHAAEMVAKNEIFHYYDIGNRADAAGVHWTYIGENVGVGPDVKSVHNAFMASPGHRQNVLYGAYNLIGVGTAVAKDGSVFVAHEFATVSSSAPAPAAAPAVHHTASAPVVHKVVVPSLAPKTAAPIVKVAPVVVTPAPANHTTSSDPNALMGGVVN